MHLRSQLSVELDPTIAKMNAFKVSIAYEICYCCLKKIRNIYLEMATFSLLIVKFISKSKRLQAFINTDTLC